MFVCDRAGLESVLESGKQRVCPWCGQRGWLNRHDTLMGVGAEGEVFRGRRMWCAKRDRRSGCGRTVYVVFSDVLPRHLFDATLLWKLLEGLAGGLSMAVSWERLGCRWLGLCGAYKLLGRLRQRLPVLRTALSSCCGPPRSAHADPLLQTIEHLRSAFEGRECPVSAFQFRLKRPLMG